MPTIWVTTNTREKLRELKIVTGLKSYDEIIMLSSNILELIIEVKTGKRDIGSLYDFIDSIIYEHRREVKGL